MNIKNIYAQHKLHIQEATYSCGPCSILNVLHLKGDFSHSEKELIGLCDAKRGVGSSNENVVKAAKSVGLEIVEEKENGSVEDIERNLDVGAYVIVTYQHVYSGDGHYGLITQHDDRALYFADSSYGFFRLWKDHFRKFWYNSDKPIKGWFVAVK